VKRSSSIRIGASVTAVAGTLAAAQPATEPIHALILTGANNHNWSYTSRVHKDTLEESGRFQVDIADLPITSLKDPAKLKKYQVFVIDYNGPRWGDAAEANFLAAVKEGTGVVIIHAANNAFVGWTEYEKLCGMMWITGTTGHGDFHAFDVKWTMPDHPILKGLPEFKAHPDELYHTLVNTQKSNITVLGEAFDDPKVKGTGKNEPMVMTLEYGKGRVFHTPLGHVWTGSDSAKASISDAQFRVLLARGTEWAATGKVTIGTEIKDQRPHNQLSEAEKLLGWKLLFDGKTTDSFRLYKGEKFPEKGWVVKDGVLWRQAGESIGDIVTKEEYKNFEFACDWKVDKGGNSGIMYHVTEDHSYPWETGPEMQILDDGVHQDGKKDKTRAGTMYDVVACAYDVSRPAGQWNHARIIVKGTQIEHWLNGFPVVKIDTGSQDYKAALAASKWTKYPDYNTKAAGRIALQDHGDEVMFRDIKVRELK